MAAESYPIKRVLHKQVSGPFLDEFNHVAGKFQESMSALRIKEIFAKSNGFISQFCELLQITQRECLIVGYRPIYFESVENARRTWQALLPDLKIECRNIIILGQTARVIVMLFD
ncbi:MAG: hypothetical protein HZB76_00695 [Chlamydiae bacterium]|nr:hypothetical protein [Chlamydiota bacterium]